MRVTQVLVGVAAICALVAAARISSTPVDHTFAYQGQMRNAGQLLTGPVDLRITLWDAEVGGSQVGTANQFNGLPLLDGRFSCGLDFGDSAFDGSNRWIQVEFRPAAGAGDYIMMTPRDKVSATPYALYALNSGSKALQAAVAAAQEAAQYAQQASDTAAAYAAEASNWAAMSQVLSQATAERAQWVEHMAQSITSTSRGLGMTVSAPPGGTATRTFEVAAPCLLLINCSGLLPRPMPKDQVEIRVEVDGNPIPLAHSADPGSASVAGLGNACIPLQPGAHEIRLVATSTAAKGNGTVTLTAHLVINALE